MKETKVILNMKTTLKKKAMAKARHEGLTLSDVLNFSARAYINGNLKILATSRDLAEAREEIKNGHFISQEDLFKKLAL
jgi:hypothetical protein